MQTVEEYANWGLHFMEDKLTGRPQLFLPRDSVSGSVFGF